MDVVRLSKFFRAPMHWAHRAVIFAIAQLSCTLSSRYLYYYRKKCGRLKKSVDDGHMTKVASLQLIIIMCYELMV